MFFQLPLYIIYSDLLVFFYMTGKMFSVKFYRIHTYMDQDLNSVFPLLLLIPSIQSMSARFVTPVSYLMAILYKKEIYFSIHHRTDVFVFHIFCSFSHKSCNNVSRVKNERMFLCTLYNRIIRQSPETFCTALFIFQIQLQVFFIFTAEFHFI